MKPRVIQIGRLQASLEKALADEFDTHALWRESDASAFLARHGGEFVGMATSVRFGADAKLMDALPGLRVISNFGVGYETIDVAAAKKRGIVVANTPDVLTDCVADLALGLLIDVARGLSAAERFVRRGDWLKAQFPLATRVSGKRLGILGLGRIGQAIARRAEGFDMQIRYHNRRAVEGVPYAYAASLVELAQWADFLIIAAAGGAATRNLVSTEVIAALGEKGFLINIARGSVVDESVLVRALGEKRIAGAALDVFVDEPNVPAALLELDNVVLLPHIASGTHETRAAMGNLVVENLRAFFSTGQVKTPVN
jgi:lactate dehydrogenase-like 2-hydroxyacid dehydrogenase